MSLYQRLIFNRLSELYLANQTPVRTLVLAELLGKNPRRLREALAKLERAGFIVRRGQRGGWLPARYAPRPAAEDTYTTAELTSLLLMRRSNYPQMGAN